jgi:hypothetical protein
MCAWVYLALRDERLIGAGETPQDARRLCEAKAGEMREPMGLQWEHHETPWPTVHPPGGLLIEQRGLYVIRRVPVARFDGEGGK